MDFFLLVTEKYLAAHMSVCFASDLNFHSGQETCGTENSRLFHDQALHSHFLEHDT